MLVRFLQSWKWFSSRNRHFSQWMVRRDVVVDGRTQYIHEIEESLSLTNQHFDCCGFNKWKIVKNYNQTIASRWNNSLCPNCCWRSISWKLVVRHRTIEVQCFNSKNSISILTTPRSGVKTTAPDAVALLGSEEPSSLGPSSSSSSSSS